LLQFLKDLVKIQTPQRVELAHILLAFLNRVSEYSEANKLDINQLAIVFNQIFLKYKDLNYKKPFPVNLRKKIKL